MASINFLLDIASPYAYISFYRILHTPRLHRISTFTPVLIGGIMAATNNSPPMNVPAKGLYTSHDLQRICKYHNIPIYPGTPEGFPLRTIHLGRLLIATQIEAAEKFEEVAMALFQAFWVHGKRVDYNDIAEGIVEEVVGREAKGRIVGTAGGEGKKRLIENTKMAVESGAFGLPWFIATNEKGEKDVFWGFDHFPALERFVFGKEVEGSKL